MSKRLFSDAEVEVLVLRERNEQLRRACEAVLLWDRYGHNGHIDWSEVVRSLQRALESAESSDEDTFDRGKARH